MVGAKIQDTPPLQVTKKNAACKSFWTPKAAIFSALSEFTIGYIQFSHFQPHNRRVFIKRGDFPSEDPAPPSRNGDGFAPDLRNMQGVAVSAAIRRGGSPCWRDGGGGNVCRRHALAVRQQFSRGIMPASAAAIVSNSAALVGMRRGMSVLVGFCISVAILTNSHRVKLSFCNR